MEETTLNRIKKYLDFKGINIRNFEISIGFSNGAFASQLKNGKSIGVDKLEKILNTYPDLNPNWVLTGAGEMLYPQINSIRDPQTFYEGRKGEKMISNQDVPFFNLEATAGLITSFNDKSENIIGYIHIPKAPKCDGAIQITGDSMYPLLKSGDIVMYKTLHNKATIIYGEMYLLSFDTDGDFYTTVKFLHKSDKGEEYIKLISHNKNHQDMEILIDKIRAIGFVKTSIRFNSMS